RAMSRERYPVVLSRASLEEMWRPALPVGPDSPEASMGLSFFIYARRGTRIIGHSGGQAGFVSFMYFNPATRAAIVCALNTAHQNPSAEARMALRELQEAVLQLVGLPPATASAPPGR